MALEDWLAVFKPAGPVSEAEALEIFNRKLAERGLPPVKTTKPGPA